ncbi:MAG: CHRD domain-containing protein [Acidobacteriota bacterium]|nr:MAG: CHRD domain-containing protein [Acidobacteriota bacterium]
MRRKLFLVSLILSCAAAMALPQGIKELKGLLNGYEEVPVISTAADGQFRARISNDGSSISYELSYKQLEGDVQQAHIHFGQSGANGGISVWLCSNLASPPTPTGVQPCPAAPATISGIITAAEVVGPNPGGIAPGEFDEFVKAMRAGKTYVNVHSTKFPGGEIRSQIQQGVGGHH